MHDLFVSKFINYSEFRWYAKIVFGLFVKVILNVANINGIISVIKDKNIINTS